MSDRQNIKKCVIVRYLLSTSKWNAANPFLARERHRSRWGS